MFAENPDRIFKEKRFSQNYTVLNYNDSHIVPLQDLLEQNDFKSLDFNSNTIINYRAINMDDSSDTNQAKTLKYHFLFSFLLTLLTVVFFK